MASMFSDAGPDFRWVGNERGIAGDPCWATLDMTRPGRHPGGTSDGLNSGERPGTDWIPAECDVSIRPGWFYHASEDGRVKKPGELLDIYYKSVGRGACLNLNLPPDRRGRVHENDLASLREFRRLLDATFARDFAKGAEVTASNVRGGAKAYAAKRLVDGKRDTYWATDDGVQTAEIVFQLKRPSAFSVVSLRENIVLGQRIEEFGLDQWVDGAWKEFGKGTSIGNRRLIRLSGKLFTDRVRLRIGKASASPALSEVGLYAEP
jgi:alpha-L-fucosidase